MNSTAERMRDELDAAGEAVRRANHLTHGGTSVVTWHYSHLGLLVELAGRMAQFVGHVDRAVERADVEDYAASDGRPVLEHLTEVDADLSDAVGFLERAAHALNAAWSGLGVLAYDPFPDGEPRDLDGTEDVTGNDGDGGRS